MMTAKTFHKRTLRSTRFLAEAKTDRLWYVNHPSLKWWACSSTSNRARDDPNEPGIYSGKIFEYLAARGPILAIGKYCDVVDELLKNTNAGISSLSVETTERAAYRRSDPCPLRL
jgi:hypothetical protein